MIDDAEKVLNEVIIKDNYDSKIMFIPEVEVKYHIDAKDMHKEEIIAGETSKSNCIDLMNHKKINLSNTHSEENMFKNPTCSNHLTNGEREASTL